MNDKMIEILIHLLGHLKDHNLDSDSLNDFSDGLITSGYDENEIIEVINWFLSKMNSRPVVSVDILEQKSRSIRVLHDYERLNISTETYGYLLKLKSLAVITGVQMEKVLDYLLLLAPYRVSDDELNEIIANVLFEEQRVGSNKFVSVEWPSHLSL